MIASATWARFVDRGGTLWIEARDGNKWPAGAGQMVRALSGGPRNTVEGLHRALRPWVYDARGNPVVKGDNVLVLFLDGNSQRPVVLPGVSPLDPEDPDFLPANPLGEDPNPIRGRWAARDAQTGAVTGHLQVTALDGGNSFEVVAGGTTFGEGARVALDFDAGTVTLDIGDTRVEVNNTAGTIKLGQGSETHPVALGDDLLQRLKTVVEQLIVLDGIVAAKLPSTAPAITATLTTVLADITASLAAGPPLLSTIVKVQ